MPDLSRLPPHAHLKVQQSPQHLLTSILSLSYSSEPNSDRLEEGSSTTKRQTKGLTKRRYPRRLEGDGDGDDGGAEAGADFGDAGVADVGVHADVDVHVDVHVHVVDMRSCSVWAPSKKSSPVG